MRPIGMLPTDRFAAACVYPGKLDEQAVERELAAFLQALGMRRRIVRLRAGWRLQDDPPPRAPSTPSRSTPKVAT